ncbi:integral membrane protein 2C isoform X1 [Python bivittatus]|uniref:Integral membrane protein 2 n=1 Tax=Python bivittatus TaxID=176946 RepID=A0A9F2R5J7_PYTBI|nr:integral membrane protein 2C isoform X1 [Python bivittatus]
MVKIGFPPVTAVLKPEKEAAGSAAAATSHGAKAEGLLLPQDVEKQSLSLPLWSRRSLTYIFFLALGLILLLLGLILTSTYIYRYLSLTHSVARMGMDTQRPEYYDDEEGGLECDYFEFDDSSEIRTVYEDVKIYLGEDYEEISIPRPNIGHPADIIHDFQQGLTAYYDRVVNKCYIGELNTTIVMPLKHFWELKLNIKKGDYLPQTNMIQEERMVIEHITDPDLLGSYIHKLCQGKETFKLDHRISRGHIHQRATEKCHHIRHFANTFVVDTAICQSL